jgi:hypothetical protein
MNSIVVSLESNNIPLFVISVKSRTDVTIDALKRTVREHYGNLYGWMRILEVNVISTIGNQTDIEVLINEGNSKPTRILLSWGFFTTLNLSK